MKIKCGFGPERSDIMDGRNKEMVSSSNSACFGGVLGGEDVVDSLVLVDGSLEKRLERTPIGDIRGYILQTCPVVGEQGVWERIEVPDND